MHATIYAEAMIGFVMIVAGVTVLWTPWVLVGVGVLLMVSNVLL